MTETQKQELLALVEALCEETATRADVAHLEKLVLGNPEARKLYVQSMSLHGLLYWDAAGQGAEEVLSCAAEADSKRTLSCVTASGAKSTCADRGRLQTPAPSRRRGLRKWHWSIPAVTALGLLVGISLLFLPAQRQHVAESPVSAPDTKQPVQHPPAATPLASNESMPIPDVHLPSLPDDQQMPKADVPSATVRESSPAVNTGLVIPESDVAVIAQINQRLRERWEQAEVTPAPRATDAEWVRRVYLDLLGRIPTLREAEAFFRNPSPGKREELIDSLLANRSFARNLATIWTNLLVGRSREMNVDRDALMSWLEESFARGQSWQKTVTELVSARGSASESGPANFLLAHLNNEAVPATAITSRIFLCEQLQCTQCHQHPTVKTWGQERFWEMNAFFQQASIRESMSRDPKTGQRIPVRELVDADEFGPTYYETLRGVMQVAFPRFSGVEVNPEEYDGQTPLRQQLAKLLFAGERPQPARAFVNRTWSQLMGYGFTNPVDDMGPHTPISHPELLEELTGAFVASGYDVQRLIRWICLSDAYHLASSPSQPESLDAPQFGEPPLFSRMYLKPLSPEQLFDSLRVASGAAPQEVGNAASLQQREKWLQQFYSAVDTEENSEATTFDGSLSQVLMMMNGELVQAAINPGEGQVLAEILSRNGVADSERIRQLCLAALTRYPTSEELARIRELLRRSVRQRVMEERVPPQLAISEGLKDVYWAYLNSSEFVVNH